MTIKRENFVAPRTFSDLAAIITENAKLLDQYFASNNLPMMSFAPDGPTDFPVRHAKDRESSAVLEARNQLIEVSKTIMDLATGPAEYLRQLAWSYHDILSLHAISHYDLARQVPQDNTATFAQIAKKSNVSPREIRRLLRQAMTNGIFREDSPGVISHTPASKLLATDESIRNWTAYQMEDVQRTASFTIDAMDKWPGSEEPDQTGFQLQHSTPLPMFKYFNQKPEMAQRFAKGLGGFITGEGYEVEHLVKRYKWGSLKEGATVVDVGGSTGFVSIELAKAFPQLNFVVQDLPIVIANGEKIMPAHLKEKVKLEVHDFFAPQETEGDVYLLRWILHNWSDKYAIKILRALIPKLKHGTKIVINDQVLPEPGTAGLVEEKKMRNMDQIMLVLLNSVEREESDWIELFKTADERYRFEGAVRPKGSHMHIISFTWVDEKL